MGDLESVKIKSSNPDSQRQSLLSSHMWNSHLCCLSRFGIFKSLCSVTGQNCKRNRWGKCFLATEEAFFCLLNFSEHREHY